MRKFRAEPWLCSVVMLLRGSSISFPSTTSRPHPSGPTSRRLRGGGRIVVTVVVDRRPYVLSMAYCRWRTCRRWAVHVVDRRCVSLLGCPYFRLAVCVVSGWYVSSMGGTHGGKVKSEPRQRSWFVFVTHWPGFPPPGCPLVFSFSSSSAEDEEPPSGEGRGACWWKSVVGCRCVSVGVPLLLSPSSSSTCRCSRVVVVASLSL
jgi:hypothetical protein